MQMYIFFLRITNIMVDFFIDSVKCRGNDIPKHGINNNT